MLIEVRIVDATGGGRDHAGHVQVVVGEVDGSEEIASALVAAIETVRAPARLDERDAADLRRDAVAWVKDRRAALNHGDLREAAFEFQLRWPAPRPPAQDPERRPKEPQPIPPQPWKRRRM